MCVPGSLFVVALLKSGLSSVHALKELMLLAKRIKYNCTNSNNLIESTLKDIKTSNYYGISFGLFFLNKN